MTAEDNKKPTPEEDDDEVLVRPKKAPVPELVITPAATLKVIAAAWNKLRADRPLVACLTNWVSAPLLADGLSAAGASPVMLVDSGEATVMSAKCASLLVNVGTLDRPQADAMRASVVRANASMHPWVLDPAGAGVLPLRTYLARELMRRFPAVIRGNASEILVLAGVPGAETGCTGVDTAVEAETALAEAKRLAQVTHAVVIVSGAVDYVCGENAAIVAVKNGHALMPRVSGTGCFQGALAAAFAGTLGGKERLTAALAAAVVCGLAGEKAAHGAKGPGSFKAAFVDALANLTGADIVSGGKLEVVKNK